MRKGGGGRWGVEGLGIKWFYNVGIGTEGKEGGEERIIMDKIESI